MMDKKLNILIIDDHEIVAEGVINRTKKVFPNAHCIFANNVRSVFSEINQSKIDLIICDLEFDKEPEHDGFYIIENILKLEPKSKTIALTHHNSYRIMKKAKAIGFNSFLTKACSFKEFSETLINVLKQGNYKSKTEKDLLKKRKIISRNIFSNSLNGIYDLSKRELELIILSPKTTNRIELAQLLGVNTYTIDSHYKSILSKLDLKHRKEVALFAEEFKEEILKLN